MYVEERGPADGTPILFLHGSMVAGWMWAEQVEVLSVDHRTIVPDLPGLGRSGGDTWAGFAGAAEAVAAELRERAPDGAHVVGLSLGGIVALHLAIAHPGLCRSALVSGVPEGALPGGLRLLNGIMAGVYGTRAGARLIGRMFGMPDEESMEAFVATATETDPAAIRAIVAEVSTKPLPDGLGGIGVPLLAVVGEKDTEPARRAVPFLVETVPDARGAVVPGVGHQWNAEAPDRFTEMVRAWVDRGEVLGGLEPLG
jgi:pimeloyl-ACP methyl ester carboxylesterase